MAVPSLEQDTLYELRRWLAAVDTLTEAVNSSRTLREVLDLVARSAKSLLGFDFCAVLLPDAQRQNLVITGWSGLSPDYVARVNADRPVRLTMIDAEQAPSSKAFMTGRAVTIRDIAVEPEFTPWGGVARDQGYRAMVSVPLVAGGEVVGTLNGYHAGVHDFGDHQIERLTLLANHAAIALTSARLVEQLQSLNESLRRQTDLLTKSEQIHQQLLTVALRGGGVQGIATTLSALVSRPVLIEDLRHAVLAQDGAPDLLPDAELRSATAVDHDSLAARAAGPVGTGSFLVWTVWLEGDPVARVWLPGNESALSAIDGRAVEHAAMVLSLEIMRLRTAVEVEHRLRGELLADILGGAAVESRSVVERAERLGHDLATPHAAIVGRATTTEPQRLSHIDHRAMAAVAELSAPHRPRPLVAMYRGLLVALWPLDDAGRPGGGGGRQAADEVRRAMTAVPGVAGATVAVSGTGHRDYPQGYRTARGALEIATRSGRTDTTITLEDLGIAGLLLQLDDAEQLMAFADRTLADIRRHDQQRGTQLLDTLRCYLDSRQSRTATGQALHVHPNTVTQRLQRIQTLSGVDLTNPDTIVRIRAALTLLDVATVDRPS